MRTWQTRQCVSFARSGKGEPPSSSQATTLISANDTGHELFLFKKVTWWTILAHSKRIAPGEGITFWSRWPTRLQQSLGPALDACANRRNDGDRAICIRRVDASAGQSSKPAHRMGGSDSDQRLLEQRFGSGGGAVPCC